MSSILPNFEMFDFVPMHQLPNNYFTPVKIDSKTPVAPMKLRISRKSFDYDSDECDCERCVVRLVFPDEPSYVTMTRGSDYDFSDDESMNSSDLCCNEPNQNVMMTRGGGNYDECSLDSDFPENETGMFQPDWVSMKISSEQMSDHHPQLCGNCNNQTKYAETYQIGCGHSLCFYCYCEITEFAFDETCQGSSCPVDNCGKFINKVTYFIDYEESLQFDIERENDIDRYVNDLVRMYASLINSQNVL